MIKLFFAADQDIESAMEIRLEMLKIVNNLPPEYVFDKALTEASKEYFSCGNQTTVLAVDSENGKPVGCATMCYIEMMPTFSHPTGKRAHLMNVYTNMAYRRQGIACEMIQMLIRDAEKRGDTEISLDATDQGRPLYEKLGFQASRECMVLTLPLK